MFDVFLNQSLKLRQTRGFNNSVSVSERSVRGFVEVFIFWLLSVRRMGGLILKEVLKCHGIKGAGLNNCFGSKCLHTFH